MEHDMLEVFLERARQLARARDLTKDDPEYASATALLSVHTAIAFNDVLIVKLTGRRIKADNHMAAVQEIERRCKARRFDLSGVQSLRALIAAKAKVSYGEERTTSSLASKLSVASERFETWTYKLLKEMR